MPKVLWIALFALSFGFAAPSLLIAAEFYPAPPINADAPAANDDEGGKEMSQIVDEAKKGFPTCFTDEETMTLMRASHVLKATDRQLGQAVENIASKLSRHYCKKES